MGILSNAMGGLGSGLEDAGKMYMAAGIQEDQQQKQFERQRILQQDQANLALERAKSLEIFKQSMADSQRKSTMADISGAANGIIGGQFDQARAAYKDAYTIDDAGNKVPIDQSSVNSAIDSDQAAATTAAMSDPKAVQAAALASGHFDVAKGLEGMSKSDVMNVPFGGTVIDKDTGKVIYDGSAVMKNDLEERKIAARAAGKSATVEKLTKEQNTVIDGIHKTIKEDYGDRSDPFGEEAANGKTPKDSQYLSTLANASATFAKFKMQRTGLPVSSYDAINEVKPLLDQYDDNVQSLAKAAANQIFDAKGRVKNETVAKEMSQQGISVADRSSFLSQYRNSMMTFNRFNDFAKNPQAGSARFEELMKSFLPKPAAQSSQDGGLIGKAMNYLSGDHGAPTAQDYRDQAAGY